MSFLRCARLLPGSRGGERSPQSGQAGSRLCSCRQPCPPGDRQEGSACVPQRGPRWFSRCKSSPPVSVFIAVGHVVVGNRRALPRRLWRWAAQVTCSKRDAQLPVTSALGLRHVSHLWPRLVGPAWLVHSPRTPPGTGGPSGWGGPIRACAGPHL